MNTLVASLLLVGMHHGLPLWGALLIQSLVWHAMLAPHTWRDFLGGMNLYRVRRGGQVKLPASGVVRVSSDGEWVVKWLLAPPGLLKNFYLAQWVAVFYFRVLPRPVRVTFLGFERRAPKFKFRQGDVGLTKLLDRMADEHADWRHDRALAIRERWLNVYDPRGEHT